MLFCTKQQATVYRTKTGLVTTRIHVMFPHQFPYVMSKLNNACRSKVLSDWRSCPWVACESHSSQYREMAPVSARRVRQVVPLSCVRSLRYILCGLWRWSCCLVPYLIAVLTADTGTIIKCPSGALTFSHALGWGAGTWCRCQICSPYFWFFASQETFFRTDFISSLSREIVLTASSCVCVCVCIYIYIYIMCCVRIYFLKWAQ
jgi:hypothetical protein